MPVMPAARNVTFASIAPDELLLRRSIVNPASITRHAHWPEGASRQDSTSSKSAQKRAFSEDFQYGWAAIRACDCCDTCLQ